MKQKRLSTGLLLFLSICVPASTYPMQALAIKQTPFQRLQSFLSGNSATAEHPFTLLATAASMYLLFLMQPSPQPSTSTAQPTTATTQPEITKKLKDLPARLATGVGAGVVFGGTYLFFPPIYFSLLLGLMLLVMLSTEWPVFMQKVPWTKPLTPFYPVLPMALLAYLNQHPQYRPLLLYLFSAVIANDAGAYFTGSLLGKIKVAPSISPGKSWEGIAGGYALAVVTLLLILFLTKKNIALPQLLLFSLLVTTFSVGGDLFESFLKRKAGLKDSGTLLPGHGGLFDRLDSMMGAAVLFFALRHQLVPLLLKS